MEFMEAIKARRSVYGIDKNIGVSEEKINNVLQQALLHTPSGYNAQSGRVVLLLNKNQDTFWSFTKEALRKVVPVEMFKATDDKINALSAGYGTILFFEDQAIVKGLMDKFPLYAANFPVWSLESAGMMQFVVWTGLAELGIGASLQHYNELIEGEVKKTFDIPESWKLVAQMPFGHQIAPLSEKTFLPLEGRFIIKA
jgi:predicted oxidoreductase (fatty acid repression mutant protein)